MAPLSPMMKQYFDIKEKHKDHILFFRLGDFYEMFFDDAKVVSRELELVLTGKDCGQEDRAPMCGIPYHSCDAYIARLIKKGYKVAICDQMEDPSLAKGLVKRDVVRVVTPGTLIESNMLDEGANNYILSIFKGEKTFGLAFADISTGRVHITSVDASTTKFLKNEMTRFSPSEIIFPPDILNMQEIGTFIKNRLNCCASVVEPETFDFEPALKITVNHFGQAIAEQYELEKSPDLVCALGGLLAYLYDTQKIGVERLVSLEHYGEEKYMLLDLNAQKNLELVETMRLGEKRGSLLWVIDKTKTAMGKRLLRRYLEQPLANPIHIEKRLNAVDELYSNTMKRMDVTESLERVYDLERLLTRIVCGTSSPREYCTFKATLEQLPYLKECISGMNSQLLNEIFKQIDTLDDIKDMIGKTIAENPPALMKDGQFIKTGFDPELDYLRSLLHDNKTVLAGIETKEKETTGIKNLKIGYNKVFGYYIEITNSNKEQIPDKYIRKQTLVNCERYITEELKQLENEILSAKEKSIALEGQIFEQLRQNISAHTQRIQNTADAIAKLDVYASFAQLAVENNYCRPIITTTGELIIQEGRHPVVEKLLGSSDHFVSNDCSLDKNQNRIAIITGPNMAGKSTYIRQVAIIVLMAQIGCFVPAKYAKIGVVDGIFTRVGASDDLSAGQSTFMVEMSEVSQILNTATGDSLLILDEVGRGTSTFDGMSIAKALIEYIADPKKLGAKTLFATHYHELTELENTLTCVKNYNTAVKKRGDDITFLRRIVSGAVDDSYGIEVSKLAGIPEWIIKRAHEVLEDLENQRPPKAEKAITGAKSDFNLQTQLSSVSAVEEMIKKIDPNTLTPIEALSKLFELKKLL